MCVCESVCARVCARVLVVENKKKKSKRGMLRLWLFSVNTDTSNTDFSLSAFISSNFEWRLVNQHTLRTLTLIGPRRITAILIAARCLNSTNLLKQSFILCLNKHLFILFLFFCIFTCYKIYFFFQFIFHFLCLFFTAAVKKKKVVFPRTKCKIFQVCCFS